MSAAPAKSRLGRGLGGLIAKASLLPAPDSPAAAAPVAPPSAKTRAAAAPKAAAAKSAKKTAKNPAKTAAKKSASAAPRGATSRVPAPPVIPEKRAAGGAVAVAEKKSASAAPLPPAVVTVSSAATAAAANAVAEQSTPVRAPSRSPLPLAASVAPAAEKASGGRERDRGREGLPEYLEIPVGQIAPSPYQARQVFAPEALHELAESIRAEGLLQPIVVRAKEGRYQLVAGERRWRAFQALKLKAIPARVVEAGDASSAALGLIENLQRDGLNPIEEAHGYASLIRDFDLTQEAVAGRVGRSRASIANTLRLLSLDEELQGYVARGLFSTGHAKVLLGVEDAAQRALLARRVIEEGLSVRATERLVQDAGKPSRSAPVAGRKGNRAANSDRDAEAVAAIEQRLISKLGARVAVLHTPKKGRIVIEYRGNEDLQRVLEKLGVEL